MIDREGAQGRLASLKPDQRRAMLLRAARYSYLEIAAHRDLQQGSTAAFVGAGRLCVPPRHLAEPATLQLTDKSVHGLDELL